MPLDLEELSGASSGACHAGFVTDLVGSPRAAGNARSIAQGAKGDRELKNTLKTTIPREPIGQGISPGMGSYSRVLPLWKWLGVWLASIRPSCPSFCVAPFVLTPWRGSGKSQMLERLVRAASPIGTKEFKNVRPPRGGVQRKSFHRDGNSPPVLYLVASVARHAIRE